MNFIVLSSARSGSTWLVDTLNKISTVTCYDELFTLRDFRYRAGAADFPFFVDWKNKTRYPFVWRYLAELYGSEQKTGFKLMNAQANRHWELLPYVLTHKIGIIHLIRRNIFDVALSLQVARNRGKFHFKEEEKVPNELPFHVDTSFLLRRMRHVHKNTDKTKKLINSFRLRSVEVQYEELLADRLNFKPIWDFLDIDFLKEPPKWELRKIRKENNFDNILNFEEVKDALQAAGLKHYLYD